MAQHWRVEASDREERTKEGRRGDSLVVVVGGGWWGGGGGAAAEEEPGLTAPPAARAAKLQHRRVREGRDGGREGGRRRMTLTLTDHCSMTVLPFHEGSKDDKVGLKNLLFFFFSFSLLHIWLPHVLLSCYKDTFLSSMQIYSAWIFSDFFFFFHFSFCLLTVRRTFMGFFFLLFLWSCRCFGPRHGSMGKRTDGEKKEKKTDLRLDLRDLGQRAKASELKDGSVPSRDATVCCLDGGYASSSAPSPLPHPIPPPPPPSLPAPR